MKTKFIKYLHFPAGLRNRVSILKYLFDCSKIALQGFAWHSLEPPHRTEIQNRFDLSTKPHQKWWFGQKWQIGRWVLWLCFWKLSFNWPTRPNNGHRWSLVLLMVSVTCVQTHSISKNKLCRWACWVTEFARLISLLFVNYRWHFRRVDWRIQRTFRNS